MRDRGALVAIAVATLLRLALAPLRILSPDEAYYLAAARRGISIPDHPPLLRLLLALADRLPGPIELRVRSIAALLAAVTALGVVSLADAIAEKRAVPAHPTLAAVLASFGLMGFAGGIVTTPDAPFLAATVWLFAVATRRPRPIPLAILAAVAVASKVAAFAPVLALAIGLAHRRNRAAALALVIGSLAVMPFAVRSLTLQAAHAVGKGALVSAPRVGPLAALGALVAGAFFLWSPPVLVRAFRERDAFEVVPGARLFVVGLSGLLMISALVSGRPPEPNWIAPAMLVVVAVASVGEPMSRASIALHVAPTALAIALFVAPDLPVAADPLARTPHVREHAERVPLPGYAVPSWRCIYDRQCDNFDAISKR
ncbi:MAG: glycosyltransferase family 39 protein [Polyangiales bacterium]